MYCGKCGAKNEDNAKFCVNCGEMIHSSVTAKVPRKSNHRFIGIIAVALVVAIILLSGIKLFGGRSAENTATQMLNALAALDLVQLFNLYPEPVQEMMIAQENMTRDEIIQQLIEQNEEIKEEFHMLGVVPKWQIEELNDVSAERLLSLKKTYSENVGISITDAKTAKVIVLINVLGFNQTQNYDAILIKYKGSWYLDYKSLGNLL